MFSGYYRRERKVQDKYMSIIEKIFGTHSERELKSVYAIADKIESLRPQMQALSDEELRGKTKEYKERLAKGETLDDLLPEAYAVVREASRRVLKMEHYEVQIIGGIIRSLSERGKLVIAILHDMDFVAENFERVIIMAHGQVLADGTARDVFMQDEALKKARLQKPYMMQLGEVLGYERAYLTVDEILRNQVS